MDAWVETQVDNIFCSMKIHNWENFLFITGYHIALAALIPAYITHFHWSSLVLFVAAYLLAGISITAGYHRLFSHRSYRARPVMEWLTLFFGTLAFESSALTWSSDHRMHHRHVDTDKDPYNIKRGFWYAHVWWVFENEMKVNPAIVRDLMKNKRVLFQHRHLLAMTVASNALVFGMGCLFMHPVAALFAGVLLRAFAIHHCTWFVNSLCHMFGSKTYAKELSAVDNSLLALVTLGEGYHNYHHASQNDYRNGVGWWHFDPTKWLLWTCARVGLVSNLRRVEKVRLQKLLVGKDRDLLLKRFKHEVDGAAFELRRRAEQKAHSFEVTATQLLKKIRETRKATKTRRKRLKLEIRALRKQLKEKWKEWIALTQQGMRQNPIDL